MPGLPVPPPVVDEASVTPPAGGRPTARPSLLRVLGHALWVGPVVTTLVFVALAAAAAVVDGDPDLAGFSGVVIVVGVAMLYGLPVSVACSAAAGLAAGAATAPLRGTSAPPWARAVVGGVAAAAVVGTGLTLFWELWGDDDVAGLVVVVTCFVTGALAVFLAGRAEGVTAAADESQRAAPWVTTTAAIVLTGALVALGFWWFAMVTDVFRPEEPADAPHLTAPHLTTPRLTVPRAATTGPEDAGPDDGGPDDAATSGAPPSLAQARQELQELQREAVAAGGDDLLWPEPAAVTEAGCTTDAGRPGTALTLTGRFTTRDLATAKDDVDFLLITQDNERAAARIVDAWTDGHEDITEMMKGEYYPVPAGATVETAHVGFDQGVGEIAVTTACGTDP